MNTLHKKTRKRHLSRRKRSYRRRLRNLRGGGSTSKNAHVFDNKCVFVHQQSAPGTKSIAIRIFCKVGSIHETPETYGIAHTVEHMCFIQPDELKLFEPIQGHSTINATTNYEYTVYKFDVNEEVFSSAISILEQMLFHTTFNEDDVAREASVVLSELRFSKFESLWPLLFYGTSYEHEVDDITYHKNNYTIKQLTDFYNTFYIPSNMIVSIVSPHKWETIFDIIKTSEFGTRLNPDAASALVIPTIQNIFKPYSELVELVKQCTAKGKYVPPCKYASEYYGVLSTYGYKYGDIRVHVVTCNRSHPDYHVVKLLETYFKHNFYNIVFKKLRMEKGNVYSTSANLEESVTPFCVFTFFITSARVRHKIIGDENAVLPNFIEALHSFSKTGFVDNELETEKNNLYRAETIDIKNSDLAVNNGMHYIFGETVVEQHKNGYDDYFNTYIKPITNNDVIRVFNTYFTKEWIIDLSILSNKTAAKYISNYAFT